MGVDVLVSCHNGVLLKKLNGEVLHYRLLPCEIARAAVKYAKELGVFPIVYQGLQDATDILAEELHPNLHEIIKNYLMRNQQFVTHFSDLSKELEGDVVEVVSMVPTVSVDEIAENLENRLGNAAKVIKLVTRTTPLSILEIAHSKVSKAEPLRYLVKKMGIGREEVLAIGDNYNDLGMLEFAGTGIVMDNAHDELKRMGFYVTASNDEDGVAVALEKFVFRGG